MINIINNIKGSEDYNKNKTYLIKKVFNNAFLFSNDRLWFVSLNDIEKEIKITTQLLILSTNIFIKADFENQSLSDGYYNIIEIIDIQDKIKLDIFENLCYIFSQQSIISFIDFFYSLIELFKITSISENLNIIGLFGELSLIKYFFENHNVDFSSNWHINNSYDKYDFSFDNAYLEVKTTTKQELSFLIKHNQLFAPQNIILTIIRINEVPNSETINSLLDYFYSKEPFCSNINFHVRLSNELIRNKDRNLFNISYCINDIHFYLNKDLETLVNIPLNISKISYEYNFSEQPDKLFDEIIPLIKN